MVNTRPGRVASLTTVAGGASDVTADTAQHPETSAAVGALSDLLGGGMGDAGAAVSAVQPADTLGQVLTPDRTCLAHVQSYQAVRVHVHVSRPSAGPLCATGYFEVLYLLKLPTLLLSPFHILDIWHLSESSAGLTPTVD